MRWLLPSSEKYAHGILNQYYKNGIGHKSEEYSIMSPIYFDYTVLKKRSRAGARWCNYETFFRKECRRSDQLPR